jgi:syntaxin-binding protein 1
VQINDLKDMLASLPQFQQQRDQYSLHLDMAQECMNLFEHHKLNIAANVEQCCATGFTAEGKTPKTIVEEMVPLLDDRAMSQLDKVRIIALYIIFREGVADEDRRRLYQHARLSITEQDMINNLVHMGIKVVKDKDNRFRGGRIRNKYSAKDDQYDLSRYKPVVQIMAEDQSTNRLDQSSFPYLRDMPQDLGTSGGSLRSSQPTAPVSTGNSLRSARPTWHKATSARQTTEHQQRYIIFVAGGVTYSEIRQAYTLSAALGKDIVIGSTHIINPESYLKDVKSLGRGGIGGNPPCGLPQHANAPGRPDWRDPAQPMPYQAILDQRHWEPEVGPPPMAPPPQAAAPQKHGALNDTMRAFSDMSVSSTGSKGSKHGGEKEKKKRHLFGKMKF